MTSSRPPSRSAARPVDPGDRARRKMQLRAASRRSALYFGPKTVVHERSGRDDDEVDAGRQDRDRAATHRVVPGTFDHHIGAAAQEKIEIIDDLDPLGESSRPWPGRLHEHGRERLPSAGLPLDQVRQRAADGATPDHSDASPRSPHHGVSARASRSALQTRLGVKGMSRCSTPTTAQCVHYRVATAGKGADRPGFARPP